MMRTPINNKNVRNAIETNSKEEKDMMNKDNNTNTIVNTATGKHTRVSYRESLLIEIRDKIIAGETFTEISKKYGILTMRTVYVWLDRYYTVKKALRDRYYKQLKDNNDLAAKAAKAKSLIDDNAWITCYEDWWGDDTPEVDVLIDGYMTPALTIIAIDYCRKNGYTYKVSSGNTYVNIEALASGKPTVITYSPSVYESCAKDDIKCILHTELELPHLYKEENEIEFSPCYDFKSFKFGKNGILSAYRNDLCSEFADKHGISLSSRLEIFLGNRKAPERFGVKEGQTITFALFEGNEFTSWKYTLQCGKFYEVEYTSGMRSLFKLVIHA